MHNNLYLGRYEPDKTNISNLWQSSLSYLVYSCPGRRPSGCFDTSRTRSPPIGCNEWSREARHAGYCHQVVRGWWGSQSLKWTHCFSSLVNVNHGYLRKDWAVRQRLVKTRGRPCQPSKCSKWQRSITGMREIINFRPLFMRRNCTVC